MTVIKSLVVAALLATVVQSASAQLYTRDSEFGADTVVVDLHTGLSWLQLSQSTGLTSADFNGAYANNWTFQNGAYAGYRIASQGEISTLVETYAACGEGPETCVSMYWSDDTAVGPMLVDRARNLIRMFGGQGVMSGLVVHGGFPTYNTAVWTGYGQVRGSTTDSWYIGSDRWAPRNGLTYLIAPIPEPSTYALMLAGLAAVGFAAKRRRPTIDQIAA